MRTLIVDDDPIALKLLKLQLERLGRTDVMPCQHAQEALDLLASRNGEIDLVFCDLQMPGIDGVEFVRHLAVAGYSGSLVLVSGEDGRILETVSKLVLAHGIPMLGTLSKPVSFKSVQSLVAKYQLPPSPRTRSARQLFSGDELRRAITDGELRLHYQPKVDLRDGALVGVEALVRWQHPTAGLVYPDQFIATAEGHGLIDALTHEVMRQALRQARLWHEAGLPLQMAINVSMDNLMDLDFPDIAFRSATDAGVGLSVVTLEVTESRLMSDLRSALDVLTRLRLKRVVLSIDDFGTGHSSLAQLRDIPFEELKLDRSFVHGAANSPAVSAITSSTMLMATQLGMKSVAEGIEDLADWTFIRSLGCDVAQGYFIARPMRGDDLLSWNTDWEKRRHGLTAPPP